MADGRALPQNHRPLGLCPKHRAGQESVYRAVNSKRPVNLDISTIKLPLPALTSITHRITGIILFIGLIFAFWALDKSLSSPAGFYAVQDALANSLLAKLVAWGLLSALAFHFVAGIKHLLMDLNIGVTLESGVRKAQITVVVSAVLVILAGVWVW
ncbi:succinate dehydrogenase subunit C [Franzmannia pantelleriensis]|uniref:Succinate dehydrogenase cytochrome b556 subunit n=1 Tax=Franzmannia pantelleriensis TaxID=48727 RepID=A0A1G9JLK8_9GAMM|nr:succinate dehydrogenase subunit C [Halomonas pantelleriensis]